jgi:hypothetical protein
MDAQLDKGTIYSESEGHQNNSNDSVSLITIEPTDIVEVSVKPDVDIGPLIPSTTIGDQIRSHDAVSDALFSDTPAQEGQSKAQRLSKTSGSKKKKINQ